MRLIHVFEMREGESWKSNLQFDGVSAATTLPDNRKPPLKRVRDAAAFCQLSDFPHILAKYKQDIFISGSLHMV
jgi:hypothetical protein